MFGTIAAATTAVAPHVGPALAAGTKAVAGAAIAYKANAFAITQVPELVNQVETARDDARDAIAARKDRITTEDQERMIS